MFLLYLYFVLPLLLSLFLSLFFLCLVFFINIRCLLLYCPLLLQLSLQLYIYSSICRPRLTVSLITLLFAFSVNFFFLTFSFIFPPSSLSHISACSNALSAAKDIVFATTCRSQKSIYFLV